MSWVEVGEEEVVRLVIREGDLGGGGEVSHRLLLPLLLLFHISHNLVQTGQLLLSVPCTHHTIKKTKFTACINHYVELILPPSDLNPGKDWL